MASLKEVSGENPREIAARVLGRALSGGAGGDYVESLLERGLVNARLKDADRRLCQELVYGIVRWRDTLDWLISRKTPSDRAQKPALQNLLRLGLYQIFWLARIPNHAAVNETVELAKRNGFGPQAGFINAVLRGYLRAFEATKAELDQLKTRQPALGYSHPEWLVQKWQERWGSAPTNQLLAWNNQPPELFARVNTLKIEPGKLLEQWRQEDVEYDFVRHDWFPENLVFRFKSAPVLDRMASFQSGGFYIQDPSTLLAVSELGPRPGETILDLCAAPGGKLTFIAQLMRNEGRLLAYDLSPERLKLVEQNCARLGAGCVELIGAPALSSPSSIRADRVLVDAPCSNTGVMRRRVDLRWRLRPEELRRLRAEQLQLLEQAAGLLKRGGTLVYSTCSLEPEENGQVVNDFLAGHADFKLRAERELRPFVEHVDGAYVAMLERD